jgi:aminopeptidase-like protein
MRWWLIWAYMDMIAYKRASSPLKVLLESTRAWTNIIGIFERSAKTYCDQLETAVSYNPFGSDHVPYLSRGMPALLTIDNDYSRYPHYHRTTDTYDQVVPKQATEILKMNVAAAAELIGY